MIGSAGATTVFPEIETPVCLRDHLQLGRAEMTRWMIGAMISLWLAVPALAGNLDATAVNDAARPAKQPATDKISASVVKLQVLLDRAQFSPGEIDGKLGENAQKALQGIRRAEWHRLRQDDRAGALGQAERGERRVRRRRLQDRRRRREGAVPEGTACQARADEIAEGAEATPAPLEGARREIPHERGSARDAQSGQVL